MSKTAINSGRGSCAAERCEKSRVWVLLYDGSGVVRVVVTVSEAFVWFGRDVRRWVSLSCVFVGALPPSRSVHGVSMCRHVHGLSPPLGILCLAQ